MASCWRSLAQQPYRILVYMGAAVFRRHRRHHYIHHRDTSSARDDVPTLRAARCIEAICGEFGWAFRVEARIVYGCVYVCTSAGACVYVHVHVCVRVFVCVCLSLSLCICLHIDMYMCTCMCLFMRTCMHVRMHLCMCMRMCMSCQPFENGATCLCRASSALCCNSSSYQLFQMCTLSLLVLLLRYKGDSMFLNWVPFVPFVLHFVHCSVLVIYLLGN